MKNIQLKVHMHHAVRTNQIYSNSLLFGITACIYLKELQIYSSQYGFAQSSPGLNRMVPTNQDKFTPNCDFSIITMLVVNHKTNKGMVIKLYF